MIRGFLWAEQAIAAQGWLVESGTVSVACRKTQGESQCVEDRCATLS